MSGKRGHYGAEQEPSACCYDVLKDISGVAGQIFSCNGIRLKALAHLFVSLILK
jgi:hypothetical protein